MSSLISSVWKKDMFPPCVNFVHIFSIYFLILVLTLNIHGHNLIRSGNIYSPNIQHHDLFTSLSWGTTLLRNALPLNDESV